MDVKYTFSERRLETATSLTSILFYSKSFETLASQIFYFSLVRISSLYLKRNNIRFWKVTSRSIARAQFEGGGSALDLVKIKMVQKNP